MSRERRSVKRQLTQDMILDPQKRVRELSEIGSSVSVDKAFPVKIYFRSGSEMERQVRQRVCCFLWSISPCVHTILHPMGLVCSNWENGVIHRVCVCGDVCVCHCRPERTTLRASWTRPSFYTTSLLRKSLRERE